MRYAAIGDSFTEGIGDELPRTRSATEPTSRRLPTELRYYREHVRLGCIGGCAAGRPATAVPASSRPGF